MSISIQHKGGLLLNFEDSGNRLLDITENAHTGFTATGATYGSDSDGNYADFTGSVTDRIDLAGALSTFQDVNEFCGAIAFKANSVSGIQTLFSFCDNTVGSREQRIYLSGTNIIWQQRDGASQFLQQPTFTVATNTLYIAYFTSGTDGPQMWIGEVGTTPTASAGGATTVSLDNATFTDFYLGVNEDSGGIEHDFDGFIYDFYATEGQLDTTSVNALHDAQKYAFVNVPMITQSNMVGLGTLVGGTDDDYTTVDGHVFQYGMTAGTVTDATNTLDHFDETAGRMGLWLTFCNPLVSDLPYKMGVLLSPLSDQGTDFATDWQSGGTPYGNARTAWNAAYGLFPSPQVLTVLMVGGTTDADNGVSEAAHLIDVQATRTSMISDWNGIVAATPWTIGSIGGSNTPANIAPINAAQLSFAAAIPKGAYLDSSNTTTYPRQDARHYSNVGLRLLGTNLYSALDTLLGDTSPVTYTIGAAGDYSSYANALLDLSVKAADRLQFLDASYVENDIAFTQNQTITLDSNRNLPMSSGSSGSTGTNLGTLNNDERLVNTLETIQVSA